MWVVSFFPPSSGCEYAHVTRPHQIIKSTFCVWLCSACAQMHPSVFLSSPAVSVGLGQFSVVKEPLMTNKKLLYRVDPGHIKMQWFSFPLHQQLQRAFIPQNINNKKYTKCQWHKVWNKIKSKLKLGKAARDVPPLNQRDGCIPPQNDHLKRDTTQVSSGVQSHQANIAAGCCCAAAERSGIQESRRFSGPTCKSCVCNWLQ